jgi:hypothetical protein
LFAAGLLSAGTPHAAEKTPAASVKVMRLIRFIIFILFN